MKPILKEIPTSRVRSNRKLNYGLLQQFSSYLEKAFSMLRSLNQAQRVPGTWFFAF
jgi:hypothetical protein